MAYAESNKRTASVMSVLPLLQLSKENFLSKDTTLRLPSDEVNDFGDGFQKIVDDLVDTFKSHKIAVGLAAPQIGINLRVAVINIDHDKQGPIIFSSRKLKRITFVTSFFHGKSYNRVAPMVNGRVV
jgi:peptide deformylase